MNILIIGTEPSMMHKFHAPLIKKFCDQGDVVHLASCQSIGFGSNAEVVFDKRSHVHKIYLSRAGLNPFKDIFTLFTMVRLMKKIRPDAVMCYTVKPVIYGMLAAKWMNVPRRTALIVGLGYAFTGPMVGKRALINKVAVRLYRVALAKVHYVCFQNVDDAKHFKSLNILRNKQSVVIVNGCGVDLEQFKPLPLPDTPITFLMVARLLGDKGVREYIAAAKTIKAERPEVSFLLLGGLDLANPDGISIEETQDWKLEGSVDWLGFRDDVPAIMARCHVFVLPSYREGLPQSTVEALASSRAVITTDAPGCRETVVNGVNGYFIPVHQVEPLIVAMMKFIDNPELIKQMAKKSRELAIIKFNANEINKTLSKIIAGNVNC